MEGQYGHMGCGHACIKDRYIREVTGVMYSVHWMLCREEDISSNPRLQKCLKEGEWTMSDVVEARATVYIKLRSS